MNDDEFRDHLRSTLEPVSSPTPELTRLRRLARRRRQRRQLTAGGLGLLLIAGAGVGIAEATNSGSGRATVMAGQSPSTAPADVTVPCRTTDVTLEVGQTLAVGPCPGRAQVTVGSVRPEGDLLIRVQGQTFRAHHTGTDHLQIYETGRCDSNGECLAIGSAVVGTITVNVGPEPSSAKGPPPEPVPCKGGPVSVLVGQQFDLTNCPVGLQSKIDDPSVLAAAGAPSEFTALRAGTTNVELFVKPQCSAGMLCPKYVRDLGTLVVTVTPAA